jgi:two-component system KDP operon response regulator KdpE
MTRILIAEDEDRIVSFLEKGLRAGGYTTVAVGTGHDALALARDDSFDLLLLDLGLPGMNGLGVIHALRGWTTVPIIVLTARDDERSKVAALDAGADDYVTKPFGMAELLARINAALRRSGGMATEPSEVVAEGLRLDLAAHRAFVGEHHDRERHLTGTEWLIVGFLVRNAGRLVTHRELIDAVWGPGYSPNPNLLRVHMTNVRRKLEDDPANPRHFKTDPGVGYRFE